MSSWRETLSGRRYFSFWKPFKQKNQEKDVGGVKWRRVSALAQYGDGQEKPGCGVAAARCQTEWYNLRCKHGQKVCTWFSKQWARLLSGLEMLSNWLGRVGAWVVRSWENTRKQDKVPSWKFPLGNFNLDHWQETLYYLLPLKKKKL